MLYIFTVITCTHTKVSVSLRSKVGPNTIPRLLGFILFISLLSDILVEKKRGKGEGRKKKKTKEKFREKFKREREKSEEGETIWSRKHTNVIVHIAERTCYSDFQFTNVPSEMDDGVR